MRILVLTSFPPSPRDMPMRQRAWHFVRVLAAAHDVTVITWAHDDGPELDALRHTADLVVLPMRSVPVGAPARIVRKARFWAGGLPPFVDAMLGERELRGVDEAVGSRGRFDLVVLTDEVTGCVPLPALHAPVALHRHNVFARALADHVAQSGSHRVRWAVERRRWEGFDRDLMRRADLVFAPSVESARALEALEPSCPVVPLPSGVDLPPPVPQGRDLAFVGWMGYPPNVDAVRWFVRVCWPQLRTRFPESGFRIVGRDPVPTVRALADDRVSVTGQVPDIALACAGARVGVVPLHYGMGMKTKTLELMAMGLPVVSTVVGAEGIGAGPDDGLLVATDAESFVAQVTRLLVDADTAAGLGAAARRYVERHHSWDAHALDHRRRVEDLVASRSRVMPGSLSTISHARNGGAGPRAVRP